MEANILDSIDPRQLGAALQRSRKRKGLTQDDAAKAIDVARTTLVAIEKGERRIKSTELLKLARAYGSPITDFVVPRPIVQPFNSVQFRGPTILSEQDRIDIQPGLNEFEDLCRKYLELEDIARSPMNRKYPAEYSMKGFSIEQAAENVAMEERNRLNLGDGPILNLQNMMEQDIGLRLFFLDMPSKFSGIYYFDDQLGGCIAINRKHPLERRRMSIAHDYAHFLTSRHEAVFSPEMPYRRIPESEKFASSFQMYFLLPTSGLARRYNDLLRSKEQVTLGDLSSLAHYYQVSFKALVLRLEGMKLVLTGLADDIERQGFKVQQAKRQLGLVDPISSESGLPSRYLYLALEAYQKEKIGESEFMRFLGVDRLEARRIAETLRQSEEPVEMDQISSDMLALSFA